MTAPETFKFKQIDHLNKTLLMNQLEVNLKMAFDWAFLCIGAWTDVVAGSAPSQYGGDYGTLRRVVDPSYDEGTVYESARKDWCWESAVDYVDSGATTQNPTIPTIYVDGVPTSPTFINYEMGRVVFPSAIPTTSDVTADYSYRNIQIYLADSVPWWQELQYRSYRIDDTHFSQSNDGSWSVGGQHRIQMPCIILEAIPKAISKPYQIGDASVWVQQDVLCNVLAESRFDRNKLTDIMRGLYDNQLWLFDPDAAVDASDFPLDANGDVANSTFHYDGLVDQTTGYRDKICRITNTSVSQVEAINTRLYQGLARITCEVVL